MFQGLLAWLLFGALALPSHFFTSSMQNAGTAADSSAVGTLTWSFTSSATGALNNSGTTITTSSNATTHYLKLTNFGFSIPGGSTIDGVSAGIAGSYFYVMGTVGSAQWKTVKIIDASGTVSATNKAVSTDMPTPSFSTVTFGGAADTWSGDAAIDWNDADSGIAISCETVGLDNSTTLQIDGIELTITYTTSGGGNNRQRRSVIGRA